MEHWYICLYKAILHEMPPDLFYLLTPKAVSIYNLWSCGQIMYIIPVNLL